ncbi:hypothetical protein NHF41_01535 [Pseudomonas proteolytica]|nr:hypothetical protein [Pseudomonas proteolytica]USX02913.1 hypothetical protein NHF41_01535 [Pseudomonas proteolytica]
MHHNPQLNVRDVSSSLTVNGGAQIRDLLTRLAAHEQVTIQAQFDNQQMTFPLQLVEDEFHALHLRLGVPSIFEDGPMIRPWRLVLEEPVALENVKGQPGALWVHEVSFKGLLVQSRGRSKPPRTFSMWFSPSGYERIAVRGTLERETARGLFAYRLSQGDVDETERLRQFILQQHRLAHPEVHA